MNTSEATKATQLVQQFSNEHAKLRMTHPSTADGRLAASSSSRALPSSLCSSILRPISRMYWSVCPNRYLFRRTYETQTKVEGANY